MKKIWKYIFLFLTILIASGFVHYYRVISKETTSFPETSNFHPSKFQQLRFAHRGGYAFGPENAIPTIVRNILERDINAIEVDVHISSDGELMLFHDDKVARLLDTEKDVLFDDLSLKEIKSISLRDRQEGEVFVPTLEEVVDTLKHLILDEERQFIIELDFKPHGENREIAVNRLVEIIEQEEKILGDGIYDYFFVSTFYPDVLSALRKRSSKIRTALAVHSDPTSSKLAARVVILLANYLIKKNEANIIEPNHCLVTPEFVDKWSSRGILINTYTANTECEKEYLRTLPVAFTTNCPGSSCEHDPSDQMEVFRNWCEDCH
ncbi:MAG: glycerophosphodiester phosphodiesterase [Bacteroidota bacterium]